jgi:geranylgeranyl diphosphate synthase, type I
MSLPVILEKYRSEVDTELKIVLGNQKLPLYDMMRYHLGWVDKEGNPVNNNPGKALRPALCLFSCEAAGGDYHKALPAAAALELVHNFSLIHDDIQDNDRERRHRPTVWSIWGKAQAINAGSAMRILANVALGHLYGDGISLEKQLLLGRRLDEISLNLIEGQYLDINFEKRFDIKPKDYLTMIGNKTGALISGSMEIGAFLATDNKDMIDSFQKIGKNLGLAFQIRDDILGVWGDSEETGKAAGNDIRRRKKSFPVVFAMEHTEGTVRQELIDIYKNGLIDEKAVKRVLEIFKLADVQTNSQNLVDKYCREARSTFYKLNIAKSLQKDMEDLVEFLTGRKY